MRIYIEFLFVESINFATTKGLISWTVEKFQYRDKKKDATYFTVFVD